VTHVATGLLHTCAATRADGLFCWGDNGAGQLGSDVAGAQPLPVPVRLVPDPVAVAAGSAHTCAVRQGGATVCWGANADGQLGEGSTSSLPIPVGVPGIPAVADIVAGGSFTCARDAHGAAFCWGDDHFGELALGRVVTRVEPARVPGVTDAVEVAAGDGHTCVVAGPTDKRKIQCWGANQAGQLGDATDEDRSTAGDAKGAFTPTRVAAGTAHTCAIAEGGGLFCWGRGGSGQLGPDRMIDTSTPIPVPLPTTRTALDVATGDAHTCVVLDDGSTACWGANADGQLGDGTTTDRSAPMPVLASASPAATPLAGVDAVTAGAGHTCAHLADQSVRCWGRNTDGQLGSGDVQPSALPVSVSLGAAPASPAVAVAAGAAHTCALDVTGNAWCWGLAADGRLGIPETKNVLAPTMPMPLGNARRVAAGGAHSCTVLLDTSVVCWGANDEGQLGVVEDPVRPSAATPVPTLHGVVRVAAGTAHTCIVLDDGTVWCWGANTSGQLGDGSALLQTKPQLARLVCR
jgi:alpha-tubulin suppressor-like RCC1 family protein